MAYAAKDFRARLHQFGAAYTTDDVLAEIQAGKTMAARMLGIYKLSENQRAQEYINRLGAYIVSKIGRPELQYYFAVVDSNDVNAYALPGGIVFITKQAFKEANGEAALLGILAHEIGHINERHAVNELKIRGNSLLFQIGSAASGFQTQSLRTVMQEVMNKGIALLFTYGLPKSNDEFAADAYAARFLSAENISLEEYQKFFKKIQEGKIRTNVMRRTHPSIQERLDRLASYTVTARGL